MLSVLLHVGGTFGSAFAPNYAAFLALRFIVGMSNMGLFMSTFVIGKNFFYKKNVVKRLLPEHCLSEFQS